MRGCSWRCLALVAAVAIFSAACADDSGTTSPDTTEPSGTAPASSEGTHESHSARLPRLHYPMGTQAMTPPQTDINTLTAMPPHHR